MTPAVAYLRNRAIPFRLHEYDSDSAAVSYGEEAAEKMGVDAERVFKTLVVSLSGGALAVGIVPVR